MSCDSESIEINFQRCGEIVTGIYLNKYIIQLNCLFCLESFKSLRLFVNHLRERHHIEIHKDEFDVFTDSDDDLSSSSKQSHVTFDPKELLKSSDEQQDNLENVTETEETNKQMVLHIKDPLNEPTIAYISDQDSIGDIIITEDESASEGDDIEDIDFTSDLSDAIVTDYCSESMSEGDEAASEEVTDITEDKKLILNLIDCYKEQIVLWNPNDANSKNRKERTKAFKKITNSLNEQMGLQLVCKNVTDMIKKMRYKFRTELQYRNHKNSRGSQHTELWYFDKLSFLSDFITYRQRNKRGCKALSNEKPALPLRNLSTEQNLQFIELYKSYPCLWNNQHIGFRFKAQRAEANDELLQAINIKFNICLSPHELQKRLYRIRYSCTQEKHRKLQCDRDNIAYKPICKFYNEIKFLEDNVGPFKCPYCDKIFNGCDQYKIHKSSHDNTLPFTCPMCNRGFAKVGNCTVHLRRHTRDYQFECEFCGKRFATSTDVNVHTRYHTGEKPYCCEVCGLSFRTWTFFDAHKRRHIKRPAHKCHICTKAFYENNKLTEHLKAHMNVRDKVCNICDKAFTSTKYLRQHKQIHDEKKKYVCKICNKDFAQYAGLSGHMKSHGTVINSIAISTFTEE